MALKKESVKKFNWGDGYIVTVKKSDLTAIPGDRVICPTPCFPVGETENEWKKNEEKTKKRRIRNSSPKI